MPQNQQVLLASRPVGAPTEANFRVVETPTRAPNDGEVVVKHLYLSLDPYMRGRMSDAKSYAPPQAIDEVMLGATVGEVVESRDPKLQPGDKVFGMGGWQQFYVGKGVRKLDERIPLTAHLGVAGMPGITAWYGFNVLGKPKAGETLVVSAAAGPVGGTVGQLAKLAGLRAVGIAGGADKCKLVVEEYGFDACLDHKAGDLREQLAAATPNGIDIDFENVGGRVLDLILGRVNPFARIPLCGNVSQYNATTPYTLKNFGALLTMRVNLQGFIISEHLDVWPQAMKELGQLVAAGKLKYREDIVDGLTSAPKAFIGMLEGANVGKLIVKL